MTVLVKAAFRFCSTGLCSCCTGAVAPRGEIDFFFPTALCPKQGHLNSWQELNLEHYCMVDSVLLHDCIGRLVTAYYCIYSASWIMQCEYTKED